jgi:glycosyltransferase involved in cell wall biosynthesis
MSQPYISVVMPVFRVERYLEQAAQSVLDQTFSDLELILVDDASPDRCGEICDQIAQRDSRVRVLHLEQNGGLSNARNQGLPLARGEYILFMDSDDTIVPDLFEKAVMSLKENPAQMVVWGVEEDYYNNEGVLASSKTVVYPEQRLVTHEQVRQHVIGLEEKTLLGYAWNKLYQLSYLRSIGLLFEQITLIEDITFNVKYCKQLESMNILNFAAHHYNRRMEDSLSQKYLPNYFVLNTQRVQDVYDLYRDWGCCDHEVRRVLGAIYARYIFSAIRRNVDPRMEMTHQQRKQFLKDLYQSELFGALIPDTRADGKVLSVLIYLLRHRSVTGCLFMGRVIEFVQTKLPILFARLK